MDTIAETAFGRRAHRSQCRRAPGRARSQLRRCRRQSRQVAAWLAAVGVVAGDRVALCLPTASVEYLALSLGAMRLGAIAVCLNARFKTCEFKHAVDNSACKLLIYSARLHDVVEASEVATQTRLLDADAIRAAWTTVSVATADQYGDEPAVSADTPARIIYTSGTTALPKACLHTHGALLHQAWSVAQRLALTHEDRFWTPLPLFHTGGWTPFLAARLVLNVPERLAAMQALLPHVPQVSNTGCGRARTQRRRNSSSSAAAVLALTSSCRATCISSTSGRCQARRFARWRYASRSKTSWRGRSSSRARQACARTKAGAVAICSWPIQLALLGLS